MDFYGKVNAAWPTSIPPLSKVEAQRAAGRLVRKFAKQHYDWNRRFYSKWCRRVWISNPGNSGRFDRGWQRLVHDVSHRVNRVLYPNPTGHRHHNGQHAEIELEMLQYVIAKGWLEGKLKPKVKVKAAPTPVDKVARLQARMARWESKRKRAENAIRKLGRQLRYQQKKAAEPAAEPAVV